MRNICLLAISLMSLSGCTGGNGSRETGQADTTMIEDPAPDQSSLAMEVRKVAEFGVQLKVPENWVSSPLSESPFRETGFYPDTVRASAPPFRVHEEAYQAFVTIFPDGFGTEIPAGGWEPLSGQAFWSENSKQLLLENGTPWAYYLVPASPPSSWGEEGFIFIQLPTTRLEVTCYASSTGEEIPMAQCDPLSGDSVVRSGTVPLYWQAAGDSILHSIQWVDEKEASIHIDKPGPNMDIRSPLQISGEARGFWFYEGDFQVTLEDSQGNQLASARAASGGDWMTEDFVPFETEISFESPDDERGYLVFHKANPSGLPENDEEYRLPVIFPPNN